MSKNLMICVRGRVQGVFFRLAAKELAQSLGLAGSVRNEPDGSVLLEVEGGEKALDEFVAWCRRGPEQSTVKSLEVSEGEVRGLTGFGVR